MCVYWCVSPYQNVWGLCFWKSRFFKSTSMCVWMSVRWFMYVCVCVCARWCSKIRISHFSLCSCSDLLFCVSFERPSVPLWGSAISFLISQFWHSVHTGSVGLTFKQEVSTWRGHCSQVVENNKCICCSESDVKLNITPRRGGQHVSQRTRQALDGCCLLCVFWPSLIAAVDSFEAGGWCGPQKRWWVRNNNSPLWLFFNLLLIRICTKLKVYY